MSNASLRVRLLTLLLGAITLVTAAQVVVTYFEALQETDEIFDYQMQQIARSFKGVLTPLTNDRPAADDSLDEQFDFVVRVWSASGAMLYQSASRSGLPKPGRMGFHDTRTADGEWRVFAIKTPDRVIEVAQHAVSRHEMAGEIALRILWPIALASPLLMGAVWLVLTRALRPLEGARRLVAQRDANDLSALPSGGLPREITPLVSEINSLFARVRTLLESQRAFLADAAHELRTPLAALLLQVQNVRDTVDRDERDRALDRLEAGVERAAHLVDQLLALARAEATDTPSRGKDRVDLAVVARDVVIELVPQADALGVDLGIKQTQPGWIEGDAAALASMLRNLIDNAIKYAGQGVVDISVLHAGTEVSAIVDDDGAGIDPSEHDRVFDRFYRLPGTGPNGSGLGLSIARAIAEAHGGRLSLDCSPSGGLRVCVALPAQLEDPLDPTVASPRLTNWTTTTE